MSCRAQREESVKGVSEAWLDFQGARGLGAERLGIYWSGRRCA